MPARLGHIVGKGAGRDRTADQGEAKEIQSSAMNTLIHFLNTWGEIFFDFVPRAILQSSALILALSLIDLALRRRTRAAFRYALWLLLPVKLILPPGLASPSSLA